jgi:hypothetical protein
MAVIFMDKGGRGLVVKAYHKVEISRALHFALHDSIFDQLNSIGDIAISQSAGTSTDNSLFSTLEDAVFTVFEEAEKRGQLTGYGFAEGMR